MTWVDEFVLSLYWSKYIFNSKFIYKVMDASLTLFGDFFHKKIMS